MHARVRSVFLSLIVLAAAVAASGCLAGDDAAGALSAPATLRVEVTDEDDAMLPFAKVVLLAGATPLLVASTGPDGVAVLTAPAGADALAVTHGNATWRGDLATRSGVVRVTLDVRGAAAPVAATPEAPATRPPTPDLGLTVDLITDLGSFAYPIALAACQDARRDADGDCGLSEPVVEVAADRSVYYSAVCCIGGAPPVWVSRDNGDSWSTLDTPLGQREAYGIEGDFAIDDAGNVYFFDIEVHSIQVTAWDKDGTHLHTVRYPSVPLVDRPWVRAEGDGVVYIVYNTGTSSVLLKSTDHGRTFPPTSLVQFPFLFANPARGAAEGELWVAGQTARGIVVWHTTDGAATWEEEVVGQLPDGSNFNFIVPAVDVSGRPYVVFDSRGKDGELDDEKDDEDGGHHVFVAHRKDDGTWSAPFMVSPPAGSHHLPWIAAGAPGAVAVAWYGTLDDTNHPDAVKEDTEWRLWIAVSLDAAADEPHWQAVEADPTPVLVGPMGRRLLDFVQVDIGPDGAVHVAYAHDPEGTGEETSVHLRTLANLPLADPDGRYFNGPRA